MLGISQQFHSPPQRAAPGVGVPGAGGTAGARRGAWLLVGDGPQGMRMFPNGAALLSGPPRSPLFAEAEGDMQSHSKTLMWLTIIKKTKGTEIRITETQSISFY